MKIRLVGAELFYAGARTNRPTDREGGMTKLTVAFRNFANASKNYVLSRYCIKIAQTNVSRSGCCYCTKF
jgi:hypothetical protein